jgi:hypothetical protein
MRRGTIAMFDALGIKGIWNRPELRESPELVTKKLHALAVKTEGIMNQMFGDEQKRRSLSENPVNAFEYAGCSFLSDTIVIGIAHKSPKGIEKALGGKDSDKTSREKDDSFSAMATYICCVLASQVVAEAALSFPSLAYRGCVATGEFEMADRFILGPAIDEAASGMDLAQAAIVWLAPSAEAPLRQLSMLNTSSFLIYPVPLKGGDIYETFAISPFEKVENQESRKKITSSILKTFDSDNVSLDVAVKKQRTAQFLMSCEKAAEQTIENQRKLNSST